ncbi:hypothetical protein AVEN_96478-1 [Araneus ventricosus]|uniref:Uncharacterized protein n=1 Tax=Araneus ventricosus TaxID=182803 RepID=A0A4Y2CX30_ARAVE|nr:hypothetical protein AVEN_96478-1 [Araneus ventricosus]
MKTPCTYSQPNQHEEESAEWWLILLSGAFSLMAFIEVTRARESREWDLKESSFSWQRSKERPRAFSGNEIEEIKAPANHWHMKERGYDGFLADGLPELAR